MNCIDLLKNQLSQLAKKVEGILVVSVTDKDGVTLLRVLPDKSAEVSLRSHFLSSHAVAFDQAGKLSVGRSKALVCLYANHQLVVFNLPPRIVTVVASSEANTGLILAMETDLANILTELKSIPDLSGNAAL